LKQREKKLGNGISNRRLKSKLRRNNKKSKVGMHLEYLIGFTSLLTEGKPKKNVRKENAKR
jgi:hypothetical protein